MKLLLFDIDGTLINTHGAGLRAINRAFEQLYGHADILDGITLAGQTDNRILMNAFAKIGLNFSVDQLDDIKSVYFDVLVEELARGIKKMLPGIADLIPMLHADEKCHLALLTGNWHRSARLKLDAFGLNDYFEFGAFADDAIDRVDLVPVAVDRFADRFGYKPPPQDIFVIGDTPSDILCAKPHGVVSVAVATGSYRGHELEAYEPDYLLDNLEGGSTHLLWNDIFGEKA